MADVPNKIIMMDQWDDEIFKVVGEITIAFAQLDHVLCLLPRRIKGKSIRGLSDREWKEIRKPKFIRDRCKKIRKAAAAANENKFSVPTLEYVLGEIEDMVKHRNTIAHGQWGYVKEKESGAILRRYVIWQGEEKDVDLFQLTALRDHITRLRDELQRLVPPSRPGRKKKFLVAEGV